MSAFYQTSCTSVAFTGVTSGAEVRPLEELHWN